MLTDRSRLGSTPLMTVDKVGNWAGLSVNDNFRQGGQGDDGHHEHDGGADGYETFTYKATFGKRPHVKLPNPFLSI